MTNKLYTSGTVVDSGSLNDFNTSAYNFLSAIAGTADNITAVGPLSMLSYVTGQKFFFTPTGTNTTNATININGLGGRAITKFGNTLLIAGDLVTGKVAEIVYDGVGFQLINPQTFNLTNVVPVTNGGTGATTAAQALINLGATGRLLNVRFITTNGPYTPTAGTTQIVAELQGGGGGGGGALATGAGQVSCGGGGGGGGYVRALLTSGFSGATITVGGGGAAAVGAAGSAGGSTTFAGLTAAGGAGGTISAAAAVVAAGGGAGGGGSGGLFIIPGGNGSTNALAQATGVWLTAAGGHSVFSPGAPNSQWSGATSVTGGTSPGRGGGGGGAGASTGVASAGGGGSGGCVVIYEYS